MISYVTDGRRNPFALTLSYHINRAGKKKAYRD